MTQQHSPKNAPIWYDLTEHLTHDLTNHQPLTAIDINERVIAYGDGFFSTMAVVNGEVNWLHYHQKRCAISAKNLQLKINLTFIINQLCCFAKQIKHGMLKLVICRQNQAVRGYGFINTNAHVWLKVMPSELPTVQAMAQQVIVQPPADSRCLSQQVPVLPPNLAGLKLLNAQAQALAHAELLAYQRYQPSLIDGLVKDMCGNWVEGTFCNVFYQLKNDKNQWFTSPVTISGVNGVMRQVLMDKMQQSQQFIVERRLQDADFNDLLSMFFCNAVRGVIPIERFYLADERVLSLTLPNFERFLG